MFSQEITTAWQRSFSDEQELETGHEEEKCWGLDTICLLTTCLWLKCIKQKRIILVGWTPGIIKSFGKPLRSLTKIPAQCQPCHINNVSASCDRDIYWIHSSPAASTPHTPIIPNPPTDLNFVHLWISVTLLELWGDLEFVGWVCDDEVRRVEQFSLLHQTLLDGRRFDHGLSDFLQAHFSCCTGSTGAHCFIKTCGKPQVF